MWAGFRGNWLQEKILGTSERRTAAQQPGTTRTRSLRLRENYQVTDVAACKRELKDKENDNRKRFACPPNQGYTSVEALMISNSEKNPANRRQSQRCKARQSVQVECRNGAYGLGPNLSQMVLDISDSGVRLVVTQALSIADEIEIVITAYGVSKPIKRFGIIRWPLVFPLCDVDGNVNFAISLLQLNSRVKHETIVIHCWLKRSPRWDADCHC
jgi:hypothetical protein